MTNLLCTQPRTVLILGTGYLGQALAGELHAAGQTALTADLDRGRAMHEANITKADSMLGLAAGMAPPDVVVMCASTRGGSEDAFRSLYMQGVNNVRNAFPSAHLIFCSSTSVYGLTDGRWVTEEHNVYPVSEKGRLLLQAEQAILESGGTVVRLAALYGPGRCALVGNYCGKGEALPGGEHKWMNYIHRDDAAAALHLLCTLHSLPGGIYNLVDRTPMQQGDVYTYLSGLLETPLPVYPPLPPAAGRGLTNQRVSCARLMALGWEPLYPSFVDGVHNVLEAMDN